LALSVIGPDDTACRALEQAAKRSIHRNAFDVASRTFERASLLAGTQPCQAQLLCQAAAAAWQAGQGNRTMQLLERAEQRDTSSATMLAAKHLRGHAVSRLGPVSDGLAALIEAANIASQADPERAAIILSEAVNTAFYAGDAEAMRSIANGVATIDARLPEGRARFFATMAQGMALTLSGESRRGAVLLHKASELALRSYREEDDPQWLTWAAMGPIWLRESGPARALVERAAAVARSRAAIGLLPYLICHVAIDQATTNRWAQAEATFHEAIRLSVETHQRTDRAAALARLAWLEARQGTEGRCLDHASEAIALADELGLTLCKIWVLAALGEMCLAAGRNTEAMAHFSAQRELLGRAKIADVDLSPAPELLELHLRQGETHSAARLAAEYYSSAVEKGLPWALARAARCRALLAIDRQADELFEEALQAHAKTPDAFETGRTYLAYGSKLRRSRRRADARKSLRAAAEIFHDLGANVWSTVASRELAATGVTARKRNETTRYDLTPQELQIALLLASNHSTKQAAAALFLSPKTVEYHLRNIYRKLACNTREDLAAALRSR
jgi:DNA-binding CsgD family transcriptional regulator